MQVIISGRHFDVTPEMKTRIENDVRAIFEGKTLKVTSVRVVLELEKFRFKVEFIAAMKHHDIEAAAETYDINEAIDSALHKFEVQVAKYLDKKQDHHRGVDINDYLVEEEVDDEDDMLDIQE
jgi:ribosomal subunit interface protein